MRPSEQFEIINRFRRSPPPVDVDGLARALGLDVRYAYLDKNIAGMLERGPGDRYTITINADHNPNRRRFTLAHELGHYMKHRHLVGDGLDDDRAYRSTALGKYHNTLIGPEEETDANRFAADLLMPYDLIKEVQEADGVSNPSEMARRFAVSEQAMSIRLEGLEDRI